MPSSRIRDLAIVLAICGASLFVGLGRASLWEPDEPRFAEASRQMLQRHDFLTPYFNGVPRYEKPVLLYWLQVPAYLLFGPTELAGRLPSAIAGVGCVVLLYLLGLRVTTRRAALIGALALATSFRFIVFGRQGLTDVPLICFMLAALYGFQRATEAAGDRRWALAAWASVGLAALTKGPVALLPPSIWMAYRAAIGDVPSIRRIRPIAGSLIAAAVVLPWYIAMVVLHGRDFTNFALGHEILSRFLSEDSFAPPRGFLYYLKVWPGDAAPWSAYAIAAAGWSAWRWRGLEPRDRQAIAMCLSWFAVVFLVFSASQSKVPHYVLPAYPAAALLVGVFIDAMDRERRTAWWTIPTWLTALAMAAVGVLSALVLRREFALSLSAPAFALPAILIVGALSTASYAWRNRPFHATAAVAATLALGMAFAGGWVVPRHVEPLKPMRPLGTLAGQIARPHDEIGLFGRYGGSSVIYYSGHTIRWLDSLEQALDFLAQPGGRVCVIPEGAWKELAPRLGGGATVIAARPSLNMRFGLFVDPVRVRPPGWLLVSTQHPTNGPSF